MRFRGCPAAVSENETRERTGRLTGKHPSKGSTVECQCHEPEKAVLYKIVSEHLERFFTH